MADSNCIIVHEQVVVPDDVVVEEMVALPGEKGDKGDPFTYDDFTPEQIAELQRPATEAAKVANEAAEKANKAVTDIKVLGVTLTAEEAKRESAESGRTSAESERAEAEALRETSFSQMQTTLEGLITDTRTATSNANTAAGNAENAATEANNSATLANAAADKANQAAENVDGRVTALEEKASQTYENLAAIEESGETNPNKIFIDAETNTSYRWNGTEFVSIGGGSSNTPIPFCWGDDNILNSTFTINQNVIYNSKYDTYLSFGSNSWECFFYPRKGEGKLILNNGKIIKPTLDKITDDLFVIGYKGGLAVISFETQSVVYQRDDFEVANSLIVQYSETEDLILVGDGNKLYTLSRDLATKTQIKEYTNPIIGISRRLESFQNTLSILTSDIVDAYSEGAIQKSVIHEIANAKFSNIIVNRTQGISIVVVSDDEIGIIDTDDTLRKYNLVYQGIKAAWCVTNDACIAMYVPAKRGIVRYRMWYGAFDTKTEFQDVLFPYDYSNVNQYYLPVTGYICFGNEKNIKTTKI